MPTSTLPPKKKSYVPEEEESGVGGTMHHVTTTGVAFLDSLSELPAKRARPERLPKEEKLVEWLKNNFEKKEEKKVAKSAAYEKYLEECSENPAFDSLALDKGDFLKVVKEIFDGTFGLKESSKYVGELREVKTRPNRPKVKAPSLGLKMKEIIENVITEAGNPRKGVRFFLLKTQIAHKYPALRIMDYPEKLKKSLEREVRMGHIEVVRGIGACGYYRCPGDPLREDEEENKENKKETKKKGDEEKTEEGDVENAEEGGKEGGSEKGKEEEKKEGEEGDDEAEKSAGEDKKKKKKTKRKQASYSYGQRIVHSHPQKIEDTFPLALTFMADPKHATMGKISNYINRYYPNVNIQSKLKKCLESGEEKGLWVKYSGSSYRLEADEFDPSNEDNLPTLICNAIVACNEPKQCSSKLLKQYIMDYHPDFKVDARPQLFKRAVERALNKGTLRQLSGIGLTGSFQLSKPFTPTPSMLAGTDTGDTDDEEGGEDYWEDSKVYDAYVPRPSKRRGHGRKAAIRDLDQLQIRHEVSRRKKSTVTKKGRKTTTKRRSYKEESSGSESESSSESSSSSSSSSSEEEEEEEKKVAAKTKRRQPQKQQGKPAKKTPPKKQGARSSPRKSPKSVSYVEETDSEGEEKPVRSSGKKSKRSAPAKKSQAEESDQSEDEAVSQKKSSKSTPASTKRGRRSASTKKSQDESDKSEEEDAKKSRGKKSPAASPKKSNKTSPRKRSFQGNSSGVPPKKRGRPS
ncbi:heterochromatin protein 1-binding protein 3 [Lingula anatina]|uniref:Heterochromatin protein 1-binding protein 3 n=1 Tax=Lingula anatina TaxID=7574 RepID=A0A1S3IA31_LINAN|nr:heterochromatin protein 1-binding protein 3 [Lingula anatina]|eukprot:XP_013394716.1 heterochromatin protein 1-binding protein 3 [Lingula anatina]